ncbi:MAG: hypothetical protein RB296_06880 [Acidobacteriota bacterium]|jgi:hypothetical protein|nr:hypothetical protein [Acidobacteriota bacterium]
MNQLDVQELIALLASVFSPVESDRELGILVDIPREPRTDSIRWKERRGIAAAWRDTIRLHVAQLGLERIHLFAYPDVGSNNADLPATAYDVDGALPEAASELAACGKPVAFEQVFSTCQLLLAPTEYSTTAPLKNAARKYRFRAATMPGFISAMIPALRIDYNEVNRRCGILKQLLDPAVGADVRFVVDGRQEYQMHFDLRHRAAHVSSGRFPEAGVAGNLPSGETYIVPYEGEKYRDSGDPADLSRTHGQLPVEINGHVVIFSIQDNRAVAVSGEMEAADAEGEHLRREPAYGNMAELGFGVLGDFGLTPIDEILLDEKLGFHVAFGRSDHFGGDVGPERFSSPTEVIHLDRIYIPATQPRVHLAEVSLIAESADPVTVIRDGEYQIFS